MLNDRAEVYKLPVVTLSQDSDIAPYAPDQILLNCYSCAVGIAACAVGWVEATSEGP